VSEDTSARFRATVQYDGGAFSGWQVQPAVRTVQGDIQAALSRILDHETRIDAAGRTDSGVHAVAQEISFAAPLRWTAAELCRAVNAILPTDIWIPTVAPASPDFHPRFDATARRYEYYLAHGSEAASPIRRGRAWRLGGKLDSSLLRASAAVFLGRHDFKAFARSGQPDVSPVCCVERAMWLRTPLGDLRFTVVADRFLHRMVRYLVGTMVDVAQGRREIAELRQLRGGATDVRPPEPAPPEALYLTGVRYVEGWNRPAGVPGLFPGPVISQRD
jgi:tRNA pseudouridine38-40 synthase